MPTGYTADLEDGKIDSLREYALTCARGMGFLIHMRDESLNAEMQRREVSDYYYRNLEEAEASLVSHLSLTDEQWASRQIHEVDKRNKANNEYYDREMAIYNRYRNMKDKVVGWHPPEELGGLKEFMLDQINLCMSLPTLAPFVELKPIGQYKRETLHEVRRKLKFAQDNLLDEQKRVNDANLYIDLLLESLENA